MVFFLLLILVAVALGIVGAVVKGLFYLLIIGVAENGEDAEGAGVFGGCDIIALATHGREGLQHWVMGSITERVLNGTRLPLLVVRPQLSEHEASGAELQRVEVRS